MFCCVVKNPDFSIADIEVHDAVMNAALVVPAHMDNLIAISLFIEDGLHFNLTVGWLSLGIFG